MMKFLCTLFSFTVSCRKYTVEVYTGDRDYAATDADVFIQIFGASSSTNEFQLAGRNLFGRGKYVLLVDNFYEFLYRDLRGISN